MVGETNLLAQLSLRFRPGAAAWAEVWKALAEQSDALEPTHVVRVSEPASTAATRWTEALAEELERSLSAGQPVDWSLSPREPNASIRVRFMRRQVFVDIQLRWDVPSASALLRSWIAAMPVALGPAMAFAFGRMRDEHQSQDGLDGLTDVPPVLYLDGRAVDVVGRVRLEAAPCRIEPLRGGLLLVCEDDLRLSTSNEAYALRRAMAAHLGWEYGTSFEG